ncbi:MAG TPA: cation-translocating P-type ATPase [Acetobacteraceae bacterium]
MQSRTPLDDGPQPGAASRGLTARLAAERLAAEGRNVLPRAEHRSFIRIAVDTLREPMFALLLSAGAIYLVLGDIREALILFLFACTSVGIAVVQEARTERVLESLRDLTSPRALVIRDGIEQRIAGADVVRGDLVVLAEGDRVPADATVVAAHDLTTDESLLTGEPVPVRKIAVPDAPPATQPGGDDLPYVYSGSLVVRGHGKALVTATGARSAIGRIGVAISTIETEPPRLQAETGRLVRRFAIVSLGLSAAAIPLYGFLHGGWLEAVLSGIALGMSMLPEEFPLVLTVFMVMGAWRISRARVLTRRVSSIETLGAATVLCTDKTGTLTQNRMTIVQVRAAARGWQPDGSGQLSAAATDVVRHGVLASAREPFDPMEQAFHASAPDAARHRGRVLRWEYGLRRDLLAMTNVWEVTERAELLAAAKGAPEAVADLCSLSEPERDRLRQVVDEMARQGMRVLGVARAVLPERTPRPESARDIRFQLLGLVGLADPLRPTVPAAVQDCRTAGIRVVMITGDYPQTACAIAAQAGIDSAEVVTGSDLDRMSEDALARRARTATVFARTVPEQKLRIVQALKANGDIVAMTGDGVNDAPSLKAAHIGIAMGGRGTDVAREASSLVLLDDDFASIVRAVRLGRRIYDNLRKAMAYILAIHVPIAGLALIPLLFGLPLIFWPLHIALLELVIDPMCSIVFEAEGEDEDVMRRPPRDPREPLFSGGHMVLSLIQGGLVLVFVAALFVMALRQGLPEADARTLTFTALVVTNLGLVLVNLSQGLWAMWWRNPAFWLVSGATAGVLATVLAIPGARTLFHFGPLHADDAAVACAVGIVVLIVLGALRRLAGRPQGMRL